MARLSAGASAARSSASPRTAMTASLSSSRTARLTAPTAPVIDAGALEGGGGGADGLRMTGSVPDGWCARAGTEGRLPEAAGLRLEAAGESGTDERSVVFI